MTVLLRTLKEELTVALRRMKGDYQHARSRNAFSSKVVFREYANGRVLFSDVLTDEIIKVYAVDGDPTVVIDHLVDDLQALGDMAVNGLTIALTRRPGHRYAFVLVHIQQ